MVDIDGCSGASRGRIVFEAKNARKSRPEALAELEEAMAQRGADYGVWVVPSEDRLPARAPALREVGGDKLFVVYDPEEGALALQVAYSLARGAGAYGARRRGRAGRAGAARRGRAGAGRADDVPRIKLHLTNAAGGIESARGVLEGLVERVRTHLAAIDEFVAAADESSVGRRRSRRGRDFPRQASRAWAASAKMPSREPAEA